MMQKKLQIYMQNCNGIRSKLNELRSNISSCNYDLISLTESRIQEHDLFNSELCPNGSHFVVHRKDRNLNLSRKKGGGGVVVLARNELYATRAHDLECMKTNEDVWLRIKMENGYTLLYGTFYIKPQSTYEEYEEFFENLVDIINNADDKTYVYLSGDANIPEIKWQSDPAGHASPDDYEGRIADLLVHVLEVCDLKQFNYVLNSNGRVLDLCMSNLPNDQVNLTEAMHALCRVETHHPPIVTSLSIRPSKFIDSGTVKQFAFRKANYSVIKADIEQVHWAQEIEHLHVTEGTKFFYDTLLRIIEKHVPVKRQRSSKYPIYFSNELINLIKQKNKAHEKLQKAKRSKKPDYVVNALFETFSKIRKESKDLQNECEERYLQNVQQNSKEHIKEFWAYTKSLRKTNSFPLEMKWKDEKYSTPEQIASGFARYFNSVHATVDHNLPNFEPTKNCYDSFSFSKIGEEDVLTVIKNLDTDKGVGCDGIPNFFIKSVATSIAKPVTLIFNNIVRDGVYPDEWKLGNWTPIHKTGDVGDMANYRGVSVLPGFNQVIEKLLHAQVYFSFKKHLNKKQHGFVKKKSTLSNLLEFVQNGMAGLDAGGLMDVIYMDMSKAFDRVPHKQLLQKLESLGCSPMAMKLFESYLTNRKYQVRFCGFTSSTVSPTSGVGQGSVIGPLMFLIYVNDLFDGLDCDFLAYADDVKLFNRIFSENDQQQLQKNIDYCLNWCSSNGLSMNKDKCQVLTLTRQLQPLKFNYEMEGVRLEVMSSTKDLGVIVDKRLKFDAHIESSVKKANRMLGFLMRTSRRFTQLDSIICLYNALVRSHLEYCSPVWSPIYATHDSKIESVQRRFTRFLYRKFHYPTEEYSERLRRLNMKSLADRRLQIDFLTLHKVIHHSMETSLTENIGHRVNNNGLRRIVPFALETPSTNLGTASPLYRLCSSYTEYAPNTDIYVPFEMFKTAIRRIF